LHIFLSSYHEKNEKYAFIRKIYTYFIDRLGQYGYDTTDIITGYVIHLGWVITYHTKKDIIYKVIFSILRSKYYRFLYKISPLLVILYDCIFNNWVLVHIFYFMLVYTSLIMLKRIATGTYPLSDFTVRFLRTIYYDENEYYIFIYRISIMYIISYS